VGKTTLARSLEDAAWFNCDLPSVRERFSDPETVFKSVRHHTVVLDEVHRFENPSEILKIAADEFRHLRVLATGSSTLAATEKFRDSLTGRKAVVHLTPVLAPELSLFGVTDVRARLLRGGLPEMLLTPAYQPELYAEWLDSYYARDVQELFRVEKRTAFLTLTELVLRQSGGMANITNLGKHSGLSRPTVMSYLDVLELTHVLRRLRPFHDGGRQEILHQPKLYGFDTGFVAYVHGWSELRPDETGLLLEHLVLDTLLAYQPAARVHFWRDKAGREVDFVVAGSRRGSQDAFECKASGERFDPAALERFRATYPSGRNVLVTMQKRRPHERRFGALRVTVVHVEDLPAVWPEERRAATRET
jgi:hypothetical protein